MNDFLVVFLNRVVEVAMRKLKNNHDAPIWGLRFKNRISLRLLEKLT
jgi:hypothetical protein